jgi:acetyl-CoA/propionyl-CoA carboxylase biotin carboxyl carrier protein
LEAGDAILPAYDSLIAKLIAWGRTREEAIARMRRALTEFAVAGVPTTIPFDLAVLDHPAFGAGDLATTFIADHPELLPPPAPLPPAAAGKDPAPPTEFVAEVNGRRFVVRLPKPPPSPTAPGRRPPPRLGSPERQSARSGPAPDGKELTSPIQGTVVRVPVGPGEPVRRGAVVCVVEAMKMENELVAHRDGTIETLRVAPGTPVQIGDVLVLIGPPADSLSAPET